MSKSATLTVSYGLSGDGIGAMPVAVTLTNSNTPGPTYVVLSAGDNSVTAPSGLTVQAAALVPPSGSANTKSIKSTAGDSNPGTWTNQTIIYPIGAGLAFEIHSAGNETIAIYWI